MKSITRAFSTLAFVGTVFAAGSALAAPVDIAEQAYRGQLDGIPGYERLELGYNSRNISIDDIIEAAGKEPTPALRTSVRSSLRVIADVN